jgi:hypothetical protein
MAADMEEADKQVAGRGGGGGGSEASKGTMHGEYATGYYGVCIEEVLLLKKQYYYWG